MGTGAGAEALALWPSQDLSYQHHPGIFSAPSGRKPYSARLSKEVTVRWWLLDLGFFDFFRDNPGTAAHPRRVTSHPFLPPAPPTAHFWPKVFEPLGQFAPAWPQCVTCPRDSPFPHACSRLSSKREARTGSCCWGNPVLPGSANECSWVPSAIGSKPHGHCQFLLCGWDLVLLPWKMHCFLLWFL